MPEPSVLHCFARRLRAARVAVGLSQAKLGVRVGIPEDVTSTRINRYERGVHFPDPELAQRLADAVGVPLPALMTEDDALAHVIAGFVLLPKSKQAEVHRLVNELLGAKRAEEVKAKLDRSEVPAIAPAKKRRT